jgi:hypothetical protein
VQRIKGFTSEDVALEWIAKASDTWIRNLPRMNRKSSRARSRASKKGAK